MHQCHVPPVAAEATFAAAQQKLHSLALMLSGQHADINSFRCKSDNSINSSMPWPLPPPEYIKVSAGWAQ